MNKIVLLMEIEICKLQHYLISVILNSSIQDQPTGVEIHLTVVNYLMRPYLKIQRWKMTGGPGHICFDLNFPTRVVEITTWRKTTTFACSRSFTLKKTSFEEEIKGLEVGKEKWGGDFQKEKKKIEAVQLLWIPSVLLSMSTLCCGSGKRKHVTVGTL